MKDPGYTTINILSLHCEDQGKIRHLQSHFIPPCTPFVCLFLTLFGCHRNRGTWEVGFHSKEKSRVSISNEDTAHLWPCSHLKHAWCRTRLDKLPVMWLFFLFLFVLYTCSLQLERCEDEAPKIQGEIQVHKFMCHLRDRGSLNCSQQRNLGAQS